MTEQQLSAPAKRVCDLEEREALVGELRNQHGDNIMKLLTGHGFSVAVSRLACHEAWRRAVEDTEINLSATFLRVTQVTQLAMRRAFELYQESA